MITYKIISFGVYCIFSSVQTNNNDKKFIVLYNKFPTKMGIFKNWQLYTI